MSDASAAGSSSNRRGYVAIAGDGSAPGNAEVAQRRRSDCNGGDDPGSGRGSTTGSGGAGDSSGGTESYTRTFVNFVKSLCGGPALLALPYTFDRVGYVAGPLTLFSVMVLVIVCFNLLIATKVSDQDRLDCAGLRARSNAGACAKVTLIE